MRHIFRGCKLIIMMIFMCLLMPQYVSAEELSGEIEVIINVNESNMQKYKEAFERKYPNAKINYTTYHDYDRAVKERIESGDYGDVLYVPSYFSSESFWKYLEPLGTMDELSEKYYFVEKGWIYGDTLYGIPSYAYLMGFVYNKEVFDKAGIVEIPKTIDEFKHAMELIDKHTNAIPLCTNNSIDWALNPWFTYPYIEMTGQADYKLAEFIYQEYPFSEGNPHYKVYRLLYDLVAEGLVEPNVLEGDWYNTCVKLNNGEIGCFAIGSWALEQIRSAGVNGDDVAFMAFPNEVEGEQYVTASVDFSYGVSAKSKNKELAKAYVTFMLEESGYALDLENISIFKADLYPKSIQALGDINVMLEKIEYDEKWNLYQELKKGLNLYDAKEIQRIIETAAGVRVGSFESIIEDWNIRWERNRPEGMKKPQDNSQTEMITKELLTTRELQLSNVEIMYISENPIIRVGYLRGNAPFSFESEGEFLGASYEICEEIKARTGLQLEYIGYNNTEEVIQALDNGEIDIAACIEKQEANKRRLSYSKAYLTYTNALICKDENSIEAIGDKIAAVVVGEEKDYWDGVDSILSFDTLSESVKSVENGNAYYTITNFYSANYYIREIMSKNLSMIPTTDSETLHLGFAIGANDTLVAIINKCIYDIPESTVQMFVQKHMNIDNGEITLKRFIEANSLFSITIITAVFLVILILVTVILTERMINSQKRALDMKRYEIISNLSNEYIFMYTYETDTVKFDSKFSEEFSFGGDIIRKEYAGDNFELNQLLKYIDKLKENQEPVTFRMSRENGTYEWYKMIGFPVVDKNDVVIQMIGKIVSVQKEMEEHESIKTKAEKDPLTQLYNRDGFASRTQELQTPKMIAIMDIDNFKKVNDTLGHVGGDEALKLFARKLEEIMGRDAILARYGGDEFLVATSLMAENDVRERFEKLVHAMDREMEYNGLTKKLSISLGAVYCKDEGVSVEELLKRADEALYETKSAGKNGYRMVAWTD